VQLVNKMSAMNCCLCKERLEEAFTHQLANSEIVTVVSDSLDRMFGGGTVTAILPEEALLCSVCLRSEERFLRLRAG